MKRYIFTAAIALTCATIASAQDDMYFGSAKKQSSVSVDALTKSSSSAASRSHSAYTPPTQTESYDFNPSDYSGSMRSVDEYNRRDRFNKEYAESLERQQSEESESILVSKEDYEYAMKMKKYDGYNNVTLIINKDPWYYDPWYYDSFCYPWYRTRYYSSYWYDPWYRPGVYVGWGVGFGGWSIGWGYTWGGYWSRPYYAHYGYVGRRYIGGGYISRGYVGRGGRYYSSNVRGGINGSRWTAGTRYTNVSGRTYGQRGTTAQHGTVSTQRRTYDTATRPGNVVSGNRGFGSYEQRSASTPSRSSSYGSSSSPSRSSSFSGGASRGGGFSGGTSRGGGGFSPSASRGGSRR